jgi:hypothetical protein
MKPPRKIIHVVRHKATGANIPIEIRRVDNKNIIQDYNEFTHDRKGFTLPMLCDRWDKTSEQVIEILQEFQVPGHLSNSQFMGMTQRHVDTPVQVAMFFCEYIYAIERKTKMKHNKIKPKLIEKGSLDYEKQH